MNLLRTTRHRPRRIPIVLGTLAIAALSLLPAATHAAGAQTGTATTDTSPVNLSTKIDMADGKAKQNATVVAGDARFEVLAPDVIRLEYSPDGELPRPADVQRARPQPPGARRTPSAAATAG